jgi:hypothetical protein
MKQVKILKHDTGARLDEQAVATLLEVLYELPKGSYVVSVKKDIASRTLAQNSYIHTIVENFRQIMHEQGVVMSPIQAKNVLKLQIGWYDETIINGNIVKTPMSTHDLNKEQFSQLLDLLADWWVHWFDAPLPIKFKGVDK